MRNKIVDGDVLNIFKFYMPNKFDNIKSKHAHHNSSYHPLAVEWRDAYCKNIQIKTPAISQMIFYFSVIVIQLIFLNWRDKLALWVKKKAPITMLYSQLDCIPYLEVFPDHEWNLNFFLPQLFVIVYLPVKEAYKSISVLSPHFERIHYFVMMYVHIVINSQNCLNFIHLCTFLLFDRQFWLSALIRDN